MTQNDPRNTEKKKNKARDITLSDYKHPQAPLSMGFSRQGYWRGLTYPSPGDLPNPGFEPGSPTLQADPTR